MQDLVSDISNKISEEPCPPLSKSAEVGSVCTFSVVLFLSIRTSFDVLLRTLSRSVVVSCSSLCFLPSRIGTKWPRVFPSEAN